ncbi:MAG: hypothetical protein JWO82_4471 [Akkermansiaceae bacterium]|nr:hypothetical protein [Akkermansiaceae bacterium]
MMLHWTLVFLTIALVAGIFGFSVLAGSAALVARILFGIFLVVWITSLLTRR